MKLSELIKLIEDVDDRRALSDKWLKENKYETRAQNIVGEYGYGIVYVVVDYVLPSLRTLLEINGDTEINIRDDNEYKI